MRSFNPVYTQALGTGAGGGAFWGAMAVTLLTALPVRGSRRVVVLHAGSKHTASRMEDNSSRRDNFMVL